MYVQRIQTNHLLQFVVMKNKDSNVPKYSDIPEIPGIAKHIILNQIFTGQFATWQTNLVNAAATILVWGDPWGIYITVDLLFSFIIMMSVVKFKYLQLSCCRNSGID